MHDLCLIRTENSTHVCPNYVKMQSHYLYGWQRYRRCSKVNEALALTEVGMDRKSAVETRSNTFTNKLAREELSLFVVLSLPSTVIVL